MTTLSEESSNYRASNVRRRDFRRAMGEPDVPRRDPKPRRHKDTRQWCKGVVGREHIVEVRPVREGWDWMADWCLMCGKKLRYHPYVYPWRKIR